MKDILHRAKDDRVNQEPEERRTVTLTVSATDWETIRGCLREVALGFMEEDLDGYLRANRPVVERLNQKVAEAGRTTVRRRRPIA